MAIKANTSGLWWSRIHFLIRFIGLTGVLCCGIGVAWCYLESVLDKVLTVDKLFAWDIEGFHWDYVQDTLFSSSAELNTRLAVGFLVGGVAAALLGAIVEVLTFLTKAAGRRSAVGFNAFVQSAMVIVLVIGVNWFSYHHYSRSDCTTKRLFTLQEDTRKDLSQLTGETTIVVYQRHKSFGQLNDKPDAYDFAAERKVVEKVKDLVEQFREFGPQFKVEVLDVEEEDYNKKLDELTTRGLAELKDELARAPAEQRDALQRKVDETTKGLREFREALEKTPENSIFFYANGKVQRLSFNEFYKLDKSKSKEANGGRGNLVLLYQGERSFVRKILNLYEKRPKVGVLAIHELLTTQGPEDYGLAGMKKSLEARGFEVKDIILKKWSEVAPPEPAVYTYEESKVERLEEELTEVEAGIKNLQEGIKVLGETRKLWETSTLDELTKKYADQLDGAKITEAMRQRQLQRDILPNLTLVTALLKQSREERDELLKERVGLNVDKAAEERRMTDIKAKLDRALADCDLLFIPRMTLRNVVIGDRISNRFYQLDEAQVNAVKDFMAAGKPVLACFGPINEPASDAMRMAQLGGSGPDELEKLFGRLGIKFGKQTVLFNAESKSFAERRSGLIIGGTTAEVPPVEFGEAPPIGLAFKNEQAARKTNRIRESMLIAAHARGDKTLDLRVRHPRPIYFEPENGKQPEYSPNFLITSAASWNDEQPFPSRERTPRFEMPKGDDPARGTVDEKRRGPFPIGVAVEVPVPGDWYADKSTGHMVRVAAIGSGGVFVGPELPAPKEELLLNTCNWLLGRDDLLPQETEPRSYPRVPLNTKEYNVWRWGTWAGLPLVFTYLGVIVYLIRRLR